MLSPLPFFGPVGAVRIGRIDGQLIVNPTMQQNWTETALDLIVVGFAGFSLTMVEAGANEIPEEKILEALELAHGEIVKLCEAQEELRRQAGKPKWLDMELTAELGEVVAWARDLGTHPERRPTRGWNDRRRACDADCGRDHDGLEAKRTCSA